MLLVFNDPISGVTTTWYSQDDLETALAGGEAFAVQAHLTNIKLPVLTVESEYRSDADCWTAARDSSEREHGDRDDWLFLFATATDARGSSQLVKVYLQRSAEKPDSFYHALTRSSRCAS